MHLITSLIEKYGLFAIFINAFCEGIGLPLPSYPILMVAAAMAPQMNYTLASIILTASLAALCADVIWFWGGRRFGARIVRILCKISLSPDSCVQNTNAMFVRVGPASLSFAKFIPGFSSVSIVIASAMRIPVLTVAFFDTLGVLIYIGTGVLLGTIFHDAIEDTLSVIGKLGTGGVILVVAAFSLFIFSKWLQRKRFMRELKMNRITVNELKEMIDGGLNPVILDVRPKALRESEGTIPGSIMAYEADLGSIATRFASATEVVVYCNCPNEASAVLLAKKLQQAGFKKIRPLLGGMDAWTKAGLSIEQIAMAA